MKDNSWRVPSLGVLATGLMFLLLEPVGALGFAMTREVLVSWALLSVAG